MKRPLRTYLSAAAVLLAAVVSAHAAAPSRPSATIVVHADRPGVKISPMLWGIFFEEINRAGEGGIYGEMVQNRSFEDADAPAAWSSVKSRGATAAMALDTSQPLNDKNPHSLRLEITKTGGRAGVANEGFKGIAVTKGARYLLSLCARCGGGFEGPVVVSIEGPDGKLLASGRVEGVGAEWKKLGCVLTATDSTAAGKLVLSAPRPGTLWLDMVSLFPEATWKGRPNGLRSDLAEMLAGMKPAFLRFPGGCYVEGNKLANAFRWKDTIGDVARRPGHWNLWGYRSSDGLGYHEYLQMCEDLGAEPLYVINCGMAHEDHVPMDQMGPWVEDALDAVEYANGPADIRIELRGASIRCYLDGKLIHDVTAPKLRSLYASASRVASSGEVILKVVNVSPAEQVAQVDLRGLTRPAGAASITVLTSSDPADENTFDEPAKVAPVARPLKLSGAKFRHAFPANSVTILRLGPANQ